MKIGDKEIKIGYSVALEANKKLRELRVAEWKERNSLITDSMPDGDAKKEALLNELKLFFAVQIPNEMEVRDWCYSTEGLVFCYGHAAGIEEKDRASKFDLLTDEQVNELRYDLQCVFDGKTFAEAWKKDRTRVEDESRRQGEIGFAEYQELMTSVMTIYEKLGHKETLIALGKAMDDADKAAAAKKKNEPLPGQKEMF